MYNLYNYDYKTILTQNRKLNFTFIFFLSKLFIFSLNTNIEEIKNNKLRLISFFVDLSSFDELWFELLRK